MDYKELVQYIENKGMPEELWAYAYELVSHRESKSLRAEPYRAEVSYELRPHKNWYTKETTFHIHGDTYKLKKNRERSKSSVHVRSRKYAFTYEEAVIGYNKAIEKEQEFLQDIIEDMEGDKL